mgnify:CR=1 FL=1
MWWERVEGEEAAVGRVREEEAARVRKEVEKLRLSEQEYAAVVEGGWLDDLKRVMGVVIGVVVWMKHTTREDKLKDNPNNMTHVH